MGLEPTIPASERAKTVHALGHAATVTGIAVNRAYKLRIAPQCSFNYLTNHESQGASTLLVLVLLLARLVLVGRLVWLLFVLVNLRPHYFSCSPGFGA
jgi:hypothetical protein